MSELKDILCLGHHLYEKSEVDAFIDRLNKKHADELHQLEEECTKKVGFARELTGLEQRLYEFVDQIDTVLEYECSEERWNCMRVYLKRCQSDCRTLYGLINNGYSLHIQLPFDVGDCMTPDALKPRNEEFARACAEFSPKTVTIGDRVWMKENLKLSDTNGGIFFNKDNGEVYYTWDAAKRIADAIPGWHLPTRNEWDAMINDIHDYATILFSKYGLSLTLTGSRIDENAGEPDSVNPSNNFYDVGYATRLWTADLYKDKSAWYRYFDSSNGGQLGGQLDFHGPKSSGLSVRLVKDAEMK